MTFEQYMKRLEELSKRLEDGDITLDESIACFEESVRISSECMKILKSGKGKIAEIKKNLEEVILDFSDGKNNGL